MNKYIIIYIIFFLQVFNCGGKVWLVKTRVYIIMWRGFVTRTRMVNHPGTSGTSRCLTSEHVLWQANPHATAVQILYIKINYLNQLQRVRYLSTAIATRWSIEAVQHSTSLEVHISHSSGPKIHPLLICKNKSSL